MRMLESLSDDVVQVEETTPEIPAPVTVEEEPSGTERYDDDDVELL